MLSSHLESNNSSPSNKKRSSLFYALTSLNSVAWPLKSWWIWTIPMTTWRESTSSLAIFPAVLLPWTSDIGDRTSVTRNSDISITAKSRISSTTVPSQPPELKSKRLTCPSTYLLVKLTNLLMCKMSTSSDRVSLVPLTSPTICTPSVTLLS